MILVQQNNDVYEIRFPYDPTIISMVKNVPGRAWNPEAKFWSIPLNRLGFLILQFKGTPYESQLKIESNENLNVNDTIDDQKDIPDTDISDVTLYVKDGCNLFHHQLDMLKFAKWRIEHGLVSGFILADQMGCISGDGVVRIREEGKRWTRETTLKNLYKLFKSGTSMQIRTLDEGRFVYKPVGNVLYKGTKHVIKIQAGEHTLRCTSDHKILTKNGWVPASDLNVGDVLLMNGEIVYRYHKAIFPDDDADGKGHECPRCHGTEDIVREQGSKFLGYCRKCMYKLRNGTKFSGDTIYKAIDKDGYVRLKGYPIRFSPVYERYNTGEGVYEHHQVWYEHTGYILDTSKEAIHHKNHIKTDNRFENLQLVSLDEHYALHLAESLSNLPQNHKDAEFYYAHGKKVMLVPAETRVTSVIDNGEEADVYDVTIDDPVVHNFVCNHFVVHNCGKTLQVLNWAMYLREKHEAKHCLIIACVNSAKYNWREDIIKHTNGQETPYILGTRKKKNGTLNLSTGSKEKLEDLTTLKMYGEKDGEDLPYFLILNIEAVRMHVKKKYPIADRLIELIDDGNISLIALDECHRGLSSSALQGKQVLRIKKTVKKEIQWIPMTGTPIVSKPTDVFLPLRLVDGHDCNSFYMWCQTYCVYGGYGGHEIVGFKNVPQLKSILQPNMLRRKKQDVLDLPPKIHYTEYIDNSPYQEKLYKKIVDEIRRNKEKVVKSLNPLASLLHLRQVNGSPELVDDSIDVTKKDYLTKNAKLSRLLELLDDILSEPSEKVVIFSNWVEPLRTLYKFVSKRYKTCCYTGTMKPDEREKHKQAFINNPERRVMMGTIGALGTSHTLTVARNVIFYDSPWNPSDIEQAEDRCHRPGTTDSVFVYTLITRNTVDEKVHEILSKKEGTAQFIVDDNLDLHNHPELFDLLMND